jgi:hypothetical protein
MLANETGRRGRRVHTTAYMEMARLQPKQISKVLMRESILQGFAETYSRVFVIGC